MAASLAAGAGADFHDGVAVVVFVGREERELHRELQVGDALFQGWNFLLSHLREIGVGGGGELAVVFQLPPRGLEFLPFREQILDRRMLAHGVAGALAVVEKMRIGDLAFQLLEAFAFALDEGLEVHISKTGDCAASGRRSPLQLGAKSAKLFGDAGAGRLGAAVAAREFLDPARGIDKLLFAGEKRMAGGADADFNVPARRAGMIDRAAGAANFRLVVVRMNVRFHSGKRAGKVAAKGARRK